MIKRFSQLDVSKYALVAYFLLQFVVAGAQTNQARNPVIFADVPDISVIRVGENYYMSSTTMHMSPGVPVMKSTDLINWEIVSYASKSLGEIDELNLKNGKSTYGRGSWASSMRYHNGRYYVSTFAQTTNKTYIYSTDNIEKNEWDEISFSPSYHDHTLFFDDDGRAYFIYGAGKLNIVELKSDLSGTIPGTDRVLIENASLPSGPNIGLAAEGSQMFKVNGKYYLFNITWPRGGMRTVVVHRADKITGPYEGRMAFQHLGVAQGGIIDTPEGEWFAYLFRDFGSVGRIPYLVPMKWEDGWPVIGENGKVPESLNLPASRGLMPGTVASDDFKRQKNEAELPLVWQWNHNPDNTLWSVTERKGFLRLKTGRTDTLFLKVRNTLTQRTFGPVSSAVTLLHFNKMKEGDYAGLCALQRKFGQVGVKISGGKPFVFMTSNKTDVPSEIESIPIKGKKVYLKVECDFRNRADKANFFYSTDGKHWKSIGNTLLMEYTLVEHFMGYRFGLFNYASRNAGGCADFDFFRISDQISKIEKVNYTLTSNRYEVN